MPDSLISLFASTLNVSPEILDDASSPDTVAEWDSLAAMDLVAAIEDTYAVRLSTVEIMKMRTIGIVRTVLTEKGVTVE